MIVSNLYRLSLSLALSAGELMHHCSAPWAFSMYLMYHWNSSPPWRLMDFTLILLCPSSTSLVGS